MHFYSLHKIIVNLLDLICKQFYISLTPSLQLQYSVYTPIDIQLYVNKFEVNNNFNKIPNGYNIIIERDTYVFMHTLNYEYANHTIIIVAAAVVIMNHLRCRGTANLGRKPPLQG